MTLAPSDNVFTPAKISAEEHVAARHVAAFYGKFERELYENQELLSQVDKHWLLSVNEQEAIGPYVAPPSGLIARVPPLVGTRLVLMVPVEDFESALDVREVCWFVICVLHLVRLSIGF